MKKQMLVLAVTLMMVFGAVMPAFAAEGTGTLILTGGNLSVTPAAVTFAAFTLDGTTKPSVAGTTSAWPVVDATGTGAGWNLTVAATTPTHTISNTKTIPLLGLKMTLTNEAIVLADGNTKPTSSFGSATTLTATAQKLASAALTEGMGSYTIQPTFTLAVPAQTYAGTYNTTITLLIVSGP